VAYGSYDGGLRELIHLLKYEQVRPAAGALGRMLAEAIAGLDYCWTGSPITLVPVPLHARKLRQRGFNQSELVVREALKIAGGHGRLALQSQVLERHRETQSQTGLTRHQRRENIRGAIVVARPELVAGGVVLLVDDVFTTGTTVQNAPVCCCGPAHPRYMWQLSREPSKRMPWVQPWCGRLAKMRKPWRKQDR
jgi:predicted amidophosphoribosyltransferase